MFNIFIARWSFEIKEKHLKYSSRNCILDDAQSAAVRERSNDILRKIHLSAARNFLCLLLRRQGNRGVLFFETFVALETIDFVP